MKYIFNFSIFKDHLVSNFGSVDYKVFVLLVILQETCYSKTFILVSFIFVSCKFDFIHPHTNLISCNTILTDRISLRKPYNLPVYNGYAPLFCTLCNKVNLCIKRFWVILFGTHEKHVNALNNLWGRGQAALSIYALKWFFFLEGGGGLKNWKLQHTL